MADTAKDLRFDKGQQDLAATRAQEGAVQIDKIAAQMTEFVNDFKLRSEDSKFAARVDIANAEIEVARKNLTLKLQEMARGEKDFVGLLDLIDQES